ncbi:carboxylate--amine ligase [Shouchella shacheensis]|uniref:carboxylate--amine ligase n=1 Tax=Shouchella shacheensis TaxID=1649580 RepID=UPI00073FC690|nr:ATP-grasp domain-containing protein [Shouchella shacheensis]
MAVIKKQPFIPVILGGNLGAYSLARAFHEAYGVKSLTISTALTGPIRDSVIIESVVEGKMGQAHQLLAVLDRVNERFSEVPKLLIGSDDWHVKMIVDIKGQLNPGWTVPYISSDLFHKVTNKTRFYQWCEELGISYPKTWILKNSITTNVLDSLKFPVVLKPANSVSYQAVSFPGKNKVFIAETTEELERVFDRIRGAGYSDDLILQEFIPGDDSAMHVLTLYTSRGGETKLASFGQTLLEDHTPGAIGNPLAIRTTYKEEVVEQAKRFIDHVGYVGFSNFDIKYDHRDESYNFFELNARLGRSNYYVTAQGENIAPYYVKDFLEGQPLEETFPKNETLFTVLPRRLLLNHIRDNDLQQKVKGLYAKGAVYHPLKYFPTETKVRRRFYEKAATVNYYRKFKRYPPFTRS